MAQILALSVKTLNKKKQNRLHLSRFSKSNNLYMYDVNSQTVTGKQAAHKLSELYFRFKLCCS